MAILTARLNDQAYTYDGDGKRAKKSNGKLYWYGLGSEPLTETDLPGTPSADFIFFNGKRTARLDLPGAAVHYYFSDHLGSASVVTSNTGTIQDESDYYPFGGERIITNSDPNNYKFTSKERDTESGLDNFGARFYSSALGRFSSPDPLVLSREITDPQTLNKYSYAFNRPTVLVDADGQWPGWYHHDIIERLFKQLGSHAIEVLETASDWMDDPDTGNQAPERAYMHAKSNGKRDAKVRVAEAERDTNNYIETELQAAVDSQLAYEAAGGTGYGDDALTHFGRALHTVTDRTSPQHVGYQPWYCYYCLSGAWHGVAENNSASSSNTADAEARHQARIEADRLRTRFEAQLVAERKKKEEERKKKNEPCGQAGKPCPKNTNNAH